jgi:IclR family acetate operon transcriptional repressor
MAQYGETVTREETPVRSVQRALDLLTVVADGEGIPLAKLAEETGLAPSTAHRLLTTMVDLGFIRQDEASRRYAPGPRLLGLVSAAEQRLAALRAAALPHMTELAGICGETAHLTILDGPEVVFIEQVLGRGTIRVDVKVGSRMDAHVTAAGQPLFDAGLRRFTPNTLTRPEDLRRDFDIVRERGWASELEEHELGAGCVAAAVMPASGTPVASLSVSGPTSRLQPQDFGMLGERIRQAADRVAEALLAPE